MVTWLCFLKNGKRFGNWPEEIHDSKNNLNVISKKKRRKFVPVLLMYLRRKKKKKKQAKNV